MLYGASKERRRSLSWMKRSEVHATLIVSQGTHGSLSPTTHRDRLIERRQSEGIEYPRRAFPINRDNKQTLLKADREGDTSQPLQKGG